MDTNITNMLEITLRELGELRGLVGWQADRLAELSKEVNELREIVDVQSAQIAALQEQINDENHEFARWSNQPQEMAERAQASTEEALEHITTINDRV